MEWWNDRDAFYGFSLFCSFFTDGFIFSGLVFHSLPAVAEGVTLSLYRYISQPINQSINLHP